MQTTKDAMIYDKNDILQVQIHIVVFNVNPQFHVVERICDYL